MDPLSSTAGPRFFVPSLVLCTPPGPPKDEEDEEDDAETTTPAAPSDVANGAHSALLS